MAVPFTDLDTAVRSKYIPTLIEQIFIAHPFLTRMLSKNKVVFDSGANIRQPVVYGRLAGGSYSGMDTFDITVKNTQTMAQWNWKNCYANVTIPGDDLAKAEGDEKIVGLLESKMEIASLGMNEDLATFLAGDGTGNGGKDFDGLLNALDDGTTYASYGGITRSSSANTWWNANVDATGGAVTLDLINTMIGSCTIGEKKPDLILTTQTLYNKVWSRVQPQQRFLQGGGKNSDLASVGFSGIEFNGHAAMMVDNHIPSGYMIFLNTDFWKFIINKNRNFYWTNEKNPVDADAYVRQLLLMGNFICQAPRLQGILTGLT